MIFVFGFKFTFGSYAYAAQAPPNVTSKKAETIYPSKPNQPKRPVPSTPPQHSHFAFAFHIPYIPLALASKTETASGPFRGVPFGFGIERSPFALGLLGLLLRSRSWLIDAPCLPLSKSGVLGRVVMNYSTLADDHINTRKQRYEDSHYQPRSKAQ